MTDAIIPTDRNDTVRRILRRRFRMAALAVGLPLIGLTALALAFLQSNQDGVAFAQAFHAMGHSIRGVETETYRATIVEERRNVHVADARRHFMDLLGHYAAIRAADPDGEAMASEGTGPSDPLQEVNGLFAQFDLDLAETIRRSGIVGAEMPESLEAIWEFEDQAAGGMERPPLETGVAWFILAVAPVFMNETPSVDDLKAGARAMAQISDFVIRDQLDVLAQVLKQHGAKSAETPVFIVLSMCGLVLIALIAVNLWILRPAASEVSLIQDELVGARLKAQDSERAKSEFLASMSHEIRTPMNGVIAMSELLVGTRLDDQQRMFAETIHASGQSLLGIINDVLDFSKIDAGRLELHPKPFKISQIAQEPGKLLSIAAAEKGVELLTRVDRSLPETALGDFARIRQIVVNLAGNAIKFTDHGQVLIDVSRVEPPGPGPQAGAGPEIRVEVRDTGCGIPADSLAKIFDMFTQVDGTYARSHQGAGLGLAISKGLVDLMGGEIGVESIVGGGSTFWFTIPLAAASPAGAETPVNADFRDKRVLVIDDNETNRMILHELLDAWRMEESSVSSGREGLRKLSAAAKRGRPYNLVILDHHMPGMTGDEALGAIWETPEIAETPVIMLSSMDMSIDGLASGDKRPVAFLTKPTSASELFDAVATALATRGPVAGDTPAAIGAPTVQVAGPAPREGTDFLILVVDDNEVNRRVAASVLDVIGIAHAEIGDGPEAPDAYAVLRPQMVLMDVSMPGMDGYEATSEIRKIEAELGLPRSYIVGLTAHAMSGDREKCLAAGMDDYLPKPVSTEALNEMCQARKAFLKDGPPPTMTDVA